MSYPTSVWDGSTPDREPGQAKSPSYIDWNVLVQELIATQNEVDAIKGGDLDGFTVGERSSEAGSGVTLSSTVTSPVGFYCDDGGVNIAESVSNVLGRTLLTIDQSAGSVRSLMGQLKLLTGIDVSTGIYTAVQGYVELAGTHSAKTGSTFSCVDASLEIGTALTVDSGGEACGIHVETTGAGTITNSGTCAGILVDKASGAASWPAGLLIDGPSVVRGVRVGKFAGSAATTSAVLFNNMDDIYGDGQYDVLEAHGASNADMTSAACAKVGRFRHVITTASGSVAHETYGVMGQVVVKATTLTHLHSGLIGTFEGHTSGVVLNSSYVFGHAGILSRVDGHAAITATTPLCGFLAFNNASAALAGGLHFAYGATAYSGTYPWDALLASDKCNAILYVPTATDYEAGVKAVTGAAPTGTVTHFLKVRVGASTYAYVPAYTADTAGG